MNLIDAPVMVTSNPLLGKIVETIFSTRFVSSRISGVLRSAICTVIRALRPSAVTMLLANPVSSLVPRGR